MSLVAAMGEPGPGVIGADEVHAAANRDVECVASSGAEVLKDAFEFAPAELDGVEVGRWSRPQPAVL